MTRTLPDQIEPGTTGAKDHTRMNLGIPDLLWSIAVSLKRIADRMDERDAVEEEKRK